MKFNTIEEAIQDLKQGKMIIVSDDENRENEGDIIFPAQNITHNEINFMLNHARGLICLSLTSQKAKTLGLKDMVEKNTDIKKTAFTQSIDATPKHGVTTGISAFDRAKTISLAAQQNASAQDFNSPGHIFPLIAKDGGVLKRVGHTEASVDICRFAGFEPCAVICEILNEDGTMARRDDLFKFAQKHDLKYITVADLITYKLKKERYVTREAEAFLPTEYGDFTIYGYLNKLNGQEHVALVKDDGSDKLPLVRMHSECLTGDLFHSLKCDCNSQLVNSLKMIDEYGKGALVYLKDHEGRGIGLINKIKAYKLQEQGQDTIEANHSLGFETDLRDYGDGAQILLDLGYEKFKLITNNPIKIIGLEGYGLQVEDRVEVQSCVTEYNKKYLDTKKNEMHHLLNV